MTLARHCIFDKATGKFLRSFEGVISQLPGNIGEGEASVEGAHDMLGMRVAVEQGPPWQVVAVYYAGELEAQRIAISSALARMQEIDIRKIRAITDINLNASADARQRLADLEAESESQRQIIRDNTPKT